MNPIILAAVVVILTILFLRFYRTAKDLHYTYQLAAKIPGPPAAFLIGNSLQLPLKPEEIFDYMIGVGNEYAAKGAEVIRFWTAYRLQIVPLTGRAIQAILESKDEITKAIDYESFTDWLAEGLLTSTGEKWKTRRRLLTPTFHFKMLEGYVEVFNKQSKRLLNVFDHYSTVQEEVDVVPLIKRCTLDTICETTMGVDINSQQNPEHEYAVAVDEITQMINNRAFQPWLWLRPIRILTGFDRKEKELLKALKGFTEKVITARQELLASEDTHSEDRRGKTFLDMLLEMKEANSLSDEDIREEVETITFAGHDTISSSLSWVLWNLATNPEIERKLYAEIYDRFGDSDRDVTTEDLNNMDYLDRVFKETLRLNPPAPFPGRTLMNDLKIGDYLIPKGAQVLVAPGYIHRNEQIYPDHMKFNPDRFLPENVKKRHPFDYIPFSAGPRNCLGQKFARYEQKIILIWIMRKFKFSTSLIGKTNRMIIQVVTKPELGTPLLFERR